MTDTTTPRKLVDTRVLYLVVDPMTVNDRLLPSGLAGKPYPTTTFTAHGGKTPLTWSVADGALPAGMKLSTSGSLSGTPTASGLHEFTVQVADASSPKNIATRDFGIVVTPMTVTTALPPAVVGKAITSIRMTTNGGTGPFIWTISEWALPPGLTLTTAGALSGTPTTSGTFSFTVKVFDASTPRIIATRTYHYTVAPFAISTSSLPNGTGGKTHPSTKIAAHGGKGTLVWTMAQGALPAGLKLSGAGYLSGTPTAAGTYTFTAQVVDSSTPKNVATREFSITIE